MTKRILIVTPGSDSRTGGVERFNHLVAAALAVEHDVSFVETRRPSPPRLAALGWLQESAATASLIKSSKPDLILTGVTVGWSFDPTIPRIHVCHGTMVNNAWASRGEPPRARVSAALGGGLAEGLATRRAHLVAVSESTAEELRRVTFVRRKIDVIENGVDASLFKPINRLEARRALGWDPEDRLALFVGRPELRKGIDIATEAAHRAKVRLLIAGSRGHEGAEWLGLQSPERLALCYSAADFVVFPTRYEACSYAVLEAIASGSRLLTTRVGWSKDAARREPLFERLLLPPTVEAFSTAMSRQQSDPSEDVARAAIRRIVTERNSLSAFSDKWRSCVAHVLATGADWGRAK